MHSFHDLEITTLKKICSKYNLHMKIAKYSKLSKAELIPHMEKHLMINQYGKIQIKPIVERGLTTELTKMIEELKSKVKEVKEKVKKAMPKKDMPEEEKNINVEKKEEKVEAKPKKVMKAMTVKQVKEEAKKCELQVTKKINGKVKPKTKKELLDEISKCKEKAMMKEEPKMEEKKEMPKEETPNEETLDELSNKLTQKIMITPIDKIKKALVKLNFKGKMQSNKMLLSLQLLQNFNTKDKIEKLLNELDDLKKEEEEEKPMNKIDKIENELEKLEQLIKMDEKQNEKEHKEIKKEIKEDTQLEIEKKIDEIDSDLKKANKKFYEKRDQINATDKPRSEKIKLISELNNKFQAFHNSLDDNRYKLIKKLQKMKGVKTEEGNVLTKEEKEILRKRNIII